MNEAVQFEHPEADQLTAFAEHVLPAHERRDVLAHLAACQTCRQVVFLAQQAEPEESPAFVPVPARKLWLSGWNLAWAGAAAFAGIVALTLFPRPASIPFAQPAAVATMKVPPPIQPPIQAPAQPPPMAKTVPPPPPKPSRARPAIVLGAPPLTSQTAESLPIEGRNAVNFATSPSPAASSTASGSAVHGAAFGAMAGTAVATPRAEAKAAPKPGLVAQDQARMAANIPLPPPATPLAQTQQAGGPSQAPQRQQYQVAAAAPASTSPGYVTETVQVSAAADLDVTNATSTMLLASPLPLPSGLPTVSSAAHGSHMVAIDSAGSVFVSKDRGRKWKPVTAKWPGKATQIQFNADAGGFELTSSAGTIWTSKDGNSWKQRKSMAP